MTRNNFLKSIGILAGIAVSNPMKLFAGDEKKIDLKFTHVPELKFPKTSKSVTYRWTEGDRVTFARNNGEYFDAPKLHRYIKDEYSLWSHESEDELFKKWKRIWDESNPNT